MKVEPGGVTASQSEEERILTGTPSATQFEGASGSEDASDSKEVSSSEKVFESEEASAPATSS